jgi:hypothetical protein
MSQPFDVLDLRTRIASLEAWGTVYPIERPPICVFDGLMPQIHILVPKAPHYGMSPRHNLNLGGQVRYYTAKFGPAIFALNV